MVTATLYIEGGGEGKDLRTRFRQGWKEFFSSAGVGGRTKIVRGAGRRQTFDRFATAVSGSVPGTVPFLLVDSEGPVAPEHSVWQHLHARDGWTRPDGARDDRAFLMVQVMETWFLADREALRSYFGAGFGGNALRAWPNLEDVPKSTVSKHSDARPPRAANAMPRARSHSSCWRMSILPASKPPVRTPERS